ncbi:MAG: hypothetical protein C0504_20180 [Candidatus Solibacter sp.]|nr:hypothetical protein [Candidatus Solibacter sp.]
MDAAVEAVEYERALQVGQCSDRPPEHGHRQRRAGNGLAGGPVAAPVDERIQTATPAPARPPSRRSFWVRQITLWHWVSSGVCLAGMLLFTITGVTLNHASAIQSVPVVKRQKAEIPAGLRAGLAAQTGSGKQPLPVGLRNWLAGRFEVKTMADAGEWSESEVYISLPRPGGDAWILVDRETAEAEYESTDRGWISYLNDLHKGRHTGTAWFVFIDVLAAACLIFTATGLLLLQVHAAKRPSTWPLVGLGMAAPLLLMLFFVHR